MENAPKTGGLISPSITTTGTNFESPSIPEHDSVNHPTHYASDAKCAGCGESIECIEVTRHLPFARGNAIKYLWRAGKKLDGAAEVLRVAKSIEDLKKAIWYIEDEIAQLEGGQNPNVHRLANPSTGMPIINNPPCKFNITGENLNGTAWHFHCKTHNFNVYTVEKKAPESCPKYEGEIG